MSPVLYRASGTPAHQVACSLVMTQTLNTQFNSAVMLQKSTYNVLRLCPDGRIMNSACETKHGFPECRRRASEPRALFLTALEPGSPWPRCRLPCHGPFLLRLPTEPSCCALMWSPLDACVWTEEASSLLSLLRRTLTLS